MAQPKPKPKPKSEVREYKDYNTGYRSVSHVLDVPDRQPHEPVSITSHAKETSTNRWVVQTHHGPFEQKDEQGSYYKHISNTQFEGPLSKLKPVLKRSVSEQWKGVSGARG